MVFKLKSASLAAFAAAAMLAPLTSGAAPKATLYGAGATLPAIAYSGSSWLGGNPPACFDTITGNEPVGGCSNPAPSPALRLTAAADAGSHFGEWTASTPSTLMPAVYPAFFAGSTTRPVLSYCQTGSGYGKNILTGANNPAVGLSAACPNYGTSVGGTSNTGISAPAGQIEPDFAASDAPLTQTEYNTYMTNKSAAHVEPVQMPVVAGAIAVIYNNPQTGSLTGGAPITLTESEICQIFSGQITDWHQLSGGIYPSKPIRVVYRSDSSGTTFGMTNHLSSVCPTANPTTVTGFSTQQTFNTAFSGYTAGSGGVISSQATWVAASGNGGVVTSVFNTDGGIGYAELADATVRAKVSGGTANLQYAKIRLQPGVHTGGSLINKPYKAMDPVKNIAKSFKLATGAVVNDTVLGPNDANGRPTMVALSPIPVRPGCVKLVNPNSYATSVMNTTTQDYQYYPIVAVSYLLTHGSGNGDSALDLQALLASYYGGPAANGIKQTVLTTGKGSGFAYLAGFPNPTKTIKTCITP